MKKILVALFALLSLNIFSANEDNVKKISVTGNAQREIMPDMATLSFQIKDKDKSLSVASSKVKQKLEKFKKDLRTKNLVSGDVETVSISDRKIKDKNYSILATVKYEIGSSRDLGSLYNGVLTRMWIKEDV